MSDLISATIPEASTFIRPNDSSAKENQSIFRQLILDSISLMQEATTTKDSRLTSQIIKLTMILRRTFDPVEFLRCSMQLFPYRTTFKMNSVVSIILEKFIFPQTQSLKDRKVTLIQDLSMDLDCFDQKNNINKDVVAFLDDCSHPSQGYEKQYTDPLKIIEQTIVTGTVSSELGAVSEHPLKNTMKPDNQSSLELFIMLVLMMKVIEAGFASSSLQLAQSILSEYKALMQSKTFSDLFTSKVVFYISWIYCVCRNYHELSEYLMKVHRAASIHNHSMTQAVCLNMILKIFIQTSQYEQATKFLKEATFPQDSATNAQLARNLFYLAQIAAVQMNYTIAHTRVVQALRKAPAQGAKSGRGFRTSATKLLIILQLLLGEIPERRMFDPKNLSSDLVSYCHIVQSVRSGDLTSFKNVIQEKKQLFFEDGNLVLIQRLHHNVIRAGLRKIASAYSCISLNDIATKLGLDTSDDPESIISKAIADGVVSAVIDSETNIVYKKLEPELRSWHEIRRILGRKVETCLLLQNDAVKAMKYSVNKEKSAIEDANRRRELQEQLARVDLDKLDGGDDGDLI